MLAAYRSSSLCRLRKDTSLPPRASEPAATHPRQKMVPGSVRQPLHAVVSGDSGVSLMLATK